MTQATKRLFPLPPVLGVALLVQAALLPTQALPAQAGDLAKTVAVVDMVKVGDAYPRIDEIKADLTKRQQEFENKLKECQKRIETLQLEIKALDPKSEEYAEKKSELEVLTYDYDMRDKRYGQKMTELTQEMLGQVYKEIRSAIADISKQRGLLLVLRARESELPARLQAKGEAVESRERDVLYFDKSLDITEDVIKLMKARPSAPAATSDKGGTSKSGASEAGGTKKTEK